MGCLGSRADFFVLQKRGIEQTCGKSALYDAFIKISHPVMKSNNLCHLNTRNVLIT